ncbi:hypothetical protein L6E12_05630 [Actinokineospora sp. PR83]|uniref:hypothetical protein n=1 Tax=Actinokineospora sp. PR83 TaxID=2884908 RepID=UPI001F463028|nr:hypothetical protein [Actinokineospora sp. PR83]MCG8915271.1 hypothetical protein [Actinokineospora sp. PR83]
MTTTPQPADWNWLGPLLDFGGCLTFACGANSDQVLGAFDIDPDTAVERTLQQTMSDPAVKAFREPPFWVRVADLGEWAVAVEVAQAKGYLDQIELDLSVDFDVLTMVFSVVDPPILRLLGQYGVITAMSLSEGYDTRWGSDPHGLDPALESAGLLDFTAHPPRGTAFSRAAAAVAAQLDIELDADTFTGPLLTGSRDHPYMYAPGPRGPQVSP